MHADVQPVCLTAYRYKGLSKLRQVHLRSKYIVGALGLPSDAEMTPQGQIWQRPDDQAMCSAAR